MSKRPRDRVMRDVATRGSAPMLAAARDFWQLSDYELGQLPALGRTLLVEQWTFPDGSPILELSTRCPPDAALRVAAQMAVVLRAYGVDLTGPQQTKTRATLDFFSTRTESPRTTDKRHRRSHLETRRPPARQTAPGDDMSGSRAR